VAIAGVPTSLTCRSVQLTLASLCEFIRHKGHGRQRRFPFEIVGTGPIQTRLLPRISDDRQHDKPSDVMRLEITASAKLCQLLRFQLRAQIPVRRWRWHTTPTSILLPA
jgi:hypothetical protein